jgi:hypothetical protein
LPRANTGIPKRRRQQKASYQKGGFKENWFPGWEERCFVVMSVFGSVGVVA